MLKEFLLALYLLIVTAVELLKLYDTLLTRHWHALSGWSCHYLQSGTLLYTVAMEENGHY